MMPLKLIPHAKALLPVSLSFTDGSIASFTKALAVRWESLGLTPIVRICKQRTARRGQKEQCVLRIWAVFEDPSKLFGVGDAVDAETAHYAAVDALAGFHAKSCADLWIQQELEGYYAQHGKKTAIPVKVMLGPETGEYQLFLPLAPRQASRIRNHRRKQLAFSPTGHGVMWESRYTDGGVFVTRETKSSIFVDYTPTQTGHWRILAGDLFPVSKTGYGVSRKRNRLVSISPTRLFERTLPSVSV